MNLVKSNLVLLSVTGVLGVFTTLQLWSESESFVDYSRIPLMFDGFTEDNVGFVTIGKPKEQQPDPNPATPEKTPPIAYDQLYLQRTGEGWVIGQLPGQLNNLAGAPVNLTQVETNVFAHLRLIRSDKETMIQQNATPAQLEDYGLDEAHATLMKISDLTGQNVVASIYIGGPAAGKLSGAEAVRGVFVRKGGTTDVVLYEYEKGWFHDVDANRWVDKALLKYAPESVRRFSISNAATGGKPVVFERAGSEASWTCAAAPEGRGAVRQAEIEGFVQRNRWISILDYKLPRQRAGNLAAIGLLPPQIAFEIVYDDNGTERTAKFEVGSRVEGEENAHYLLSSEAPFLMTWPAAMVTSYEVDVAATWFDPAGPPNAEDKPGQPEAVKGPGKKPAK